MGMAQAAGTGLAGVQVGRRTPGVVAVLHIPVQGRLRGKAGVGRRRTRAEPRAWPANTMQA